MIMLAGMALIAALGVALPLIWPSANAILKIVLQWIGMPLMGAVTAGLVANSGISHYIAWLGPPVVGSGVAWLILGYPIRPEIMLLTCAVSMFGASWGYVARRRRIEGGKTSMKG